MYDVFCFFLPFPEDDFDFFLFLLLIPYRLDGSFDDVLRVEAFLLRPLTFFGLESAMMAFLTPDASAFGVRLRRGMPDLAVVDSAFSSSM